MISFRICEDIEECRHLWQRTRPAACLFDLWEVRDCFQEQFHAPPFFIIAEERDRVLGMLPLSWIGEEDCFGFFPGETWRGRTWLEQNRIIARSSRVFTELLDRIPGAACMRYLAGESLPKNGEPALEDEVGYLFFPGQYGWSFDTYMEQFSGKSRKKLRREMAVLQDKGAVFRHDVLGDLEHLFRMNRNAYGEFSYFNDARFLGAFENLAAWLYNNGRLRVTTALIGGSIAAVDMGALWGNAYTVLAGGTLPEFPGVAKLMNFHHLEYACRTRLEAVDFLCGDFGWKQRFHLTPRPLYEIRIPHARDTYRALPGETGLALAP